MGEMEPQLDISFHQMKLPALGLDYIEILAKGVHENSQTTQTIAFHKRTASRHCWRQQSTELIEHEEAKLVPT